MNPKSESLLTKTVDLPPSSTAPLPLPIILEHLIQGLPKNLSDETVDLLLESLNHLEVCFCERYVEHIQRLIEQDYNVSSDPLDFDCEEFDDTIPLLMPQDPP